MYLSILHMNRLPGLLSLPPELQLHIATYLINDRKRHGCNDYEVCNLLHLALTCKQMASIARYALCSAPVLQSSKTDVLIAFLFKYPDLIGQITSLTIETKETTKKKAYPVYIAHLDSDVLSKSKRHVRTLPIREYCQDRMVASLKRSRFEDHSILLSLLLTMLPHLSRLYLGGSVLLNFPFLRSIIPNEPNDTHWRKPDWTNGPDMTRILGLIGSRLTVLELPIDLRRNLEANIWMPLSISQLPLFFPRLQWLSVPHMAATEATQTSVADVIPSSLRTLVLTDVRCNCFEPFSGNLIQVQSSSLPFPCLQEIALYHRYPSTSTDPDIVSNLGSIGIKVFEYSPKCCLQSGDEFYHPWKYTSDEIDELEESRHEEYSTKSDRAALRCYSEFE